MFSNYTRKVLRIIRQNKSLSIINILGMAIGLAASGIILSFVHQEYHFDSSLKGSEKIYRIIQKEGETENVYTYAPLAEALKDEFPEIEASIRLSFYYGFLACRAGENSYNERSAIFADPNFFNFFPFPWNMEILITVCPTGIPWQFRNNQPKSTLAPTIPWASNW